MEENNGSINDLSGTFYEKIIEHGFIFQEKCATELRENSRHTQWLVADLEYPVVTDNNNTRIDIVLRDISTQSPNLRLYAIVECKKVNPERNNWIFGKPTDVLNREATIINIEGNHNSGIYKLNSSLLKKPFDVHSTLVDNWWLQITLDKGKFKSSPQPIEDSFMQVCVGAYGLAREMFENMKQDPSDRSIFIVPVIVTTAPLYYAQYELKNVELSNGYIDKEKVSFGVPNEPLHELKWIQIDYPSNFNSNKNENLKINEHTGLRKDFQNSIYIVNSSNLLDFFSRLHFW